MESPLPYGDAGCRQVAVSMRRAGAALLLVSLLGCGPVESTSGPEPLAVRSQDAVADNGLSFNGLSFNGLSFNGLSTSEFATWFEQDVGRHDVLMRYLVRCAVPAGELRGYTDARTGRSHSWEGGLGLAPDWSGGRPATVLEQQLVSACLAAHANRFGAHVQLSVLGRNARGDSIFSAPELTDFPHQEACFFGNVFTGEGLYGANDRDSQNERLSSARGCVLACNNPVVRQGCEPLVNLPGCQSYCSLDASQTYYTSCSYNGRTYVPLTTRLRLGNVHACGDGTCQLTESCGTGSRHDACEADCGRCAEDDDDDSEDDDSEDD